MLEISRIPVVLFMMVVFVSYPSLPSLHHPLTRLPTDTSVNWRVFLQTERERETETETEGGRERQRERERQRQRDRERNRGRDRDRQTQRETDGG